MKVCEYCGIPTEDDTVICTHCGASKFKVKEEKHSVTPISPQYSDNNTYNTHNTYSVYDAKQKEDKKNQEKGNKALKTLGIGSIVFTFINPVIAFLIACFGLWKFRKSSGKTLIIIGLVMSGIVLLSRII